MLIKGATTRPFTGAPFAKNWLATDEGSWALLDCEVAPSVLVGDLPDDHALDRALRGLGAVLFSEAGRAPTIQWSVRDLEPQCLAPVFDQLLARYRNCRLRLTYYFDGWRSEVAESGQRAIERILQIQHHRDSPLDKRAFRRSFDDRDFTNEATSGIAQIMRDWEIADANINHPTLRRWLDMLLVYRVEEATGLLQVAHAGLRSPCAEILGRRWAIDAVGGYYDFVMPGVEYSNAVAGAYAQALQAGTPMFDEIFAVMRRVHAQPRWAAYKRVVLPGRTGRGETLVIVYSEMTDAPLVPFLAA
jgi:hypothetical protein